MPRLNARLSDEEIKERAEQVRTRASAAIAAIPPLLLDAIAFAMDPASDLLWEIERGLRDTVGGGDRRAGKHLSQLYEARMGLSREKVAMQRLAAELFAEAMGWRLLKNGADRGAFFHGHLGTEKMDSVRGWDHPQSFARLRPGMRRTYQPCAVIVHNYGPQKPDFTPMGTRIEQIASQIAVYRLPRSWYYPGHRSSDPTTAYLLVRLDRAGAMAAPSGGEVQ